MNQQLLTDNYLVIENFIDPERAKTLFDEFKLCNSAYKFNGDRQVPDSSSVYNYLPSLELLCEKTKEISDYIEETVLPTYTYARIYKKGSKLKRHSDRHACEISVTLHLHGDKDWPIWICTPENNVRCVTLKPGDAMIYLGCVAEHWRNEYNGQEYGQFFLHYVRSRGPCSYTHFDSEKNNEKNKDQVYEHLLKYYKESKNKKNSDNKNTTSFPVIISESTNMKVKSLNEYLKEKIKIDSVETSLNLNNETKINEIRSDSIGKISKTKLEDYIVHLESFVPQNICDLILNEYVDTNLWEYAITGSGVNIKSRNCDVIGISQPDVINQNKEIRSKIDEELYSVISSALKKYEENFPYMELEIQEDSGYELLRYERDGYYVQHTDSFKEAPRAISCSINLNDDYEGGEFAFFNREIIYKLKKGSIILFPSSFMYPHEVMPVLNGTRYSIITWIV